MNTDQIVVGALRLLRRRFGIDVLFVCDLAQGKRLFQGAESEIAPVGSDGMEVTYFRQVVDDSVVIGASQGGEAALVAKRRLRANSHAIASFRPSEAREDGFLGYYSDRPVDTFAEADASAIRLVVEYASTLLEVNSTGGEDGPALHRIASVLEHRPFYPVYQPIVRVRDCSIVGYEALTRFTDEPVRPPNVWFAEARKVGLQPALESSAAVTALAELPALPPDAYLSINVSPATLLSPELQDVLRSRPLDRLMLELTEHDVVENYSELSSAIQSLRQRGLRFAVDDAGAGFASFRHILLLRPDIIKLDASLVHKIHSDHGSRALAAALVGFALDMGSEVVAEGVESSEQLRELRDLHINYCQGYLLGRPEPAERLLRAIANV